MKREQPFKQDLKRFWLIRMYNEKGTVYKRIRLFLKDGGVHVVMLYRLIKAVKRLYKANIFIGFIPNLIASFFYNLSCILRNIHIEKSATIGPGLFIAHPSCIFIGGVIGENCFIHQCTTIGYGYSVGKEGAPKIGDNVWIGPHVVISGNIKIGSNSTIAAGAVVTKDVPVEALVVGNPARVVSIKYDNKHLHGII